MRWRGAGTRRSAARARLLLYGLSQAEIDAVKEEAGEQKARYTLRSPVEGRLIQVGVDAGDLADPKSVLMLIGTGETLKTEVADGVEGNG